MLLLTLRIGSVVHIGGGITLTVLSHHGAGVSLGIDAPREVVIRRAEVERDDAKQLARLQDDGCPHAEGVS